MAFDLDDEELKATRKLNGLDKERSDKDVEQLKDLILDRQSFLIDKKEHDEIFLKDIKAIENILAEREQDKKRIQELEEERKKVLDLIFEYGQIDGGHHKMWVIDQIVRILTRDKYNEWVKTYVYDEETGDIYNWDKGIAP